MVDIAWLSSCESSRVNPVKISELAEPIPTAELVLQYKNWSDFFSPLTWNFFPAVARNIFMHFWDLVFLLGIFLFCVLVGRPLGPPTDCHHYKACKFKTRCFTAVAALSPQLLLVFSVLGQSNFDNALWQRRFNFLFKSFPNSKFNNYCTKFLY